MVSLYSFGRSGARKRPAPHAAHPHTGLRAHPLLGPAANKAKWTIIPHVYELELWSLFTIAKEFFPAEEVETLDCLLASRMALSSPLATHTLSDPSLEKPLSFP
jgi:hypothetical protein